MKLFASFIALMLTAPAVGQAVTPAIQSALAAPNRTSEEKARDTARKPGELLTFAGVKPGDKVADFIMGGGYFTKILAAVVGPKGKVYAYQPNEFIEYRAAYATDQDAAVKGLANVAPLRSPLASFSVPEPLDAIVTVQNFHDLHLSYAPPGFAVATAKKLFESLKPGGVLLVVDHVANADPEFKAPNAIHRIDPAAARSEVEQAGFVFEGESDVLRLKSDPHTTNVFDPAIRGKTDQFVYKFRRPK